MAISRHKRATGQQPVQKMGASNSVADLVGVILDKGIVIDAWARVSVLGLELLTIEARAVVASVETYLRYAEAIARTSLAAAPPAQHGQVPHVWEQEAGGWLPSGEGHQQLPSGEGQKVRRDEEYTPYVYVPEES
jgi:hypothetical protein